MTDRDIDHIKLIEECAFNAWPGLETIFYNGWLFRFASGYTKRANSVNALSPKGSFDETLSVAKSAYAERKIPLLFRITPLAGTGPDEILEDQNYRKINETLVMTLDIRDPSMPSQTSDPDIVIQQKPDLSWSKGFAHANGIGPDKKNPAHDNILAAIKAPTAYATLFANSQPLAYGLAVAERGMVGLFDIVTIAAARRVGAAQRLVSSLLVWGKSQGAERSYLQVESTNIPAVSLYEKLGFLEAYRYHYRISK